MLRALYLVALLALVAPTLVAGQSPCNMQAGSGLSQQAVTGIGLGVVGAVLVAFVAFIIYLRCHNHTFERKENAHSHPVLRFLKFFVEYLLFEIISLPFAVFAIIGLVTPGNWTGQRVNDVNSARIAFFVFLGLKYALVITVILVENVGLYKLDPVAQEHEIKRRWNIPAQKLRLPGTFISMIESAIFIPVVIIDGMILNAEWANGDLGDIFDYDGVVLLLIDTLLYIKLRVQFTLELHGPRPYHIPDIVYGCIFILMQVMLIFLFIINHMRFVCNNGFNLLVNQFLVVTLVVAVSHELTAGYTSMLLQGMIYRARSLKNSTLIIKQLNLYIRYFNHGFIYVILNLFLYGWQFAVYAIIYIVCGQVLGDAAARSEPVLVVGIYFITVMTLILNTFYLINLIFGFFKRVGSWLNVRRKCCCPMMYNQLPCFRCLRCYWLPPIAFNCSSYASTLNPILSKHGASFSFNSDMQT